MQARARRPEWSGRHTCINTHSSMTTTEFFIYVKKTAVVVTLRSPVRSRVAPAAWSRVVYTTAFATTNAGLKGLQSSLSTVRFDNQAQTCIALSTDARGCTCMGSSVQDAGATCHSDACHCGLTCAWLVRVRHSEMRL